MKRIGFGNFAAPKAVLRAEYIMFWKFSFSIVASCQHKIRSAHAHVSTQLPASQ